MQSRSARLTVRQRSAFAFICGALSIAGAPNAARAAEPGGFETVGPMHEARTNLATTLLQDGRVLVTGGRAGARGLACLASAEIFDPETGTFERLTAAMNDPRAGHTATRLQDGQVLLLGGVTGDFDTSTDLATAELFDPATGEFSRAGEMSRARDFHRATLLPDGRVLVTGGINPKGVIGAAELYDPATREFQPTGALTTPRLGHSAVALADGRVVVLGGLTDDDQSATQIEIYDPASGSFTPHGELTEGRAFTTAVLLPDGRILVAGGSQWYRGRTVLSSIEIYDPASGESTTIGKLRLRRSHAQIAVLAGGQVLIAGGHFQVGGPWAPIRTAELIDPATGSTVYAEPMSEARGEGAAVPLQDGRVLVLGGFTSRLIVSRTADVYVP